MHPRPNDRAFAWAYAACVAAMFATIVLKPLPLCVDYPQHLATAAQARDLMLGSGQGRLVLWTYNGLFELSVAVAGLLVPIEAAGRVLLAGSLALAQWSVWRLVRFCERPAAYAFACLPFAYSLCFAWGFVNFTLAASLATLSLIAWLEKRSPALVILLSLLATAAHVLGVPIMLGGAALGVLLRRRTGRALAQWLPVLGFVTLAQLATDPAPHQPEASSLIYPEWTARLRLGRTLLGSWHGASDEGLAVALGLVVALTLLCSCRPSLADRRPRREPFSWLTLGALVVYVLGPVAFIGCWFFYQRAGYLVTLWLPGALPRLGPGRLSRAQRAAFVALGSLATANFVVHGLPERDDTDARAIIEAIPRGAHVAPVLDLQPGASIASTLRAVPGSDAFVWGHFPAYAVALRGAEITWMFSREHGHFPVRQIAPYSFDVPRVESAWSRAYYPEQAYARYFDHVLVLTDPAGARDEPRTRIFGDLAVNTTLLAHHGRFWLYRYTPPAVAAGSVEQGL
jgi:hypothetical protein